MPSALIVNVDPLARPHDELVHGIVDHLLQQDIDAVIRMGSVAEPADIHAGPQADMLQGAEGLDLVRRSCVEIVS